MAHYSKQDIAAATGYTPTAETTPSSEPTPVENNQLYNYSQNQSDPNNVFADDSSGAEAYSDEEEKKKEEPQAEPAAPQNEAERTAAAQAQNSNLYAAIGQDTQPDPVASMQRDGVDADTQNKLSQVASMIASGNGTLADLQKNYPSYYNAYVKYYGQPAAQTPVAPTTQAQQPTPQNQILPSAGGNYQADEIYDPSKTYGRQPDGSYVYSNSAAQLQRDLNRVMDAGLKVDGYFGEKTQQALNEYLAQNGKPANEAKGDESYKMYDSPIGPSMPQSGTASSQESANSSAALAASAAEAPSNVDEALKNYAESIRPDSNQPIDYRAILESLESSNANGQTAATDNTAPTSTTTPTPTPEQPSYEPKPLTNSNTLNDEHFLLWYNLGMKTPDDAYNSMLKSHPKYAEVYADSFADWLNRGGPEATYASRAQKDAIEERGRSMDTYYRGTPENTQTQPEVDVGYNPNSTEVSQRDPINYAAMLDELSQMDRNDWYQRPESQTTNVQSEHEPINYNAMADELYQMDRNDWYQRPETMQASDIQSGSRGMGGRPMGTQRPETPYSFAEDNQEPTARFSDIPFVQGVKDVYDLFAHGYGPREEPKEQQDSQSLEYSDAFIRQQDMNDAYSPRQSFNDNYRAQLEQLQREPIEYSDAFIRQQDQMDAYSPYADYSGSMASDDIQASSNTTSSDEQAMREAYEAAMQSAGRARDIFQGLPAEAEQIQQTREQWLQNQRNALEQQAGPYMRQFQQEYASYRQQFPNYPDSAIMDMILMNEENNHGQSSYYKWLTNQL